MYYLNSRFYNPTVGRFINSDGMISRNVYVYGNNNVISEVDYSGFHSQSILSSKGDTFTELNGLWEMWIDFLNNYDGELTGIDFFDNEYGRLSVGYIKGAPRSQGTCSFYTQKCKAWVGGHVKFSVINYSYSGRNSKFVLDVLTVQPFAGKGLYNSGDIGLSGSVASARWTYVNSTSLFGIELDYEIGLYAKIFSFDVPTSFSEIDSPKEFWYALKNLIKPVDGGIIIRVS